MEIPHHNISMGLKFYISKASTIVPLWLSNLQYTPQCFLLISSSAQLTDFHCPFALWLSKQQTLMLSECKNLTYSLSWKKSFPICKDRLYQWFSKCSLGQTASSGNFLEVQILRPYMRLSRNSQGGVQKAMSQTSPPGMLVLGR